MTSCVLLVLGLAATCQTPITDAPTPANIVLAGPRHVDVRPIYDPLRPPLRPAHKFYDRPAKLELVAWGIVGGADLGQTCHALANGWQEDWIPTQRCVGLVAVSLGAIAVVELVSWALHRHGHHRLERLPRLAGIGFNAAGLVYSGRHGAFSIP